MIGTAVEKDKDMAQEIRVVNPALRRTSEYGSEPEYAMLIMIRAQQIADGDGPRVEARAGEDERRLAERELAEKKCPLMVRREVRQGVVEQWAARELIWPDVSNYHSGAH